MRIACSLVGALVAVLPLASLPGPAAAAAPAGWQPVHDRSGRCMLEVPPGWSVTTGVLAGATAPAGTGPAPTHVSIAPVSERLQPGYDQVRAQQKAAWSRMGGFTVVEDSPRRAVYRFRNAGRVQWSVVAAGGVPCMMSAMAMREDDPDVARIIDTLRESAR